ncbi:hypothetical protein [Phycicoccus sp. SLBN-51]|uniref:hypothetical protein n=1 Tax=Phycicoccus sp. SLBN-51 TaxID=2768447 RepID=UPI0011523296|nr:hypothetical protein [Phycicoccus sp. SLBN-51]TQJ50192.1 hypothetical protein FBY26_1892 [Phycicoccus sp. SLBN-51]
MDVSANHIILPLPRPQYVAVPEALTTALAWRISSVPLPPDDRGRATASLFRKGKRESTKTLYYIESDPSNDTQALERFGQALDDQGVVSEEHQMLLARALMSSLAGVRAEKGSSQAAVPITQSLALLQNMRGLQGAKNPPDVGLILERLFALGLTGPGQIATVAGRWSEAVGHRVKMDPLSSAMDRAVATGILLGEPMVEAHSDGVLPGWWCAALPNTPFSWFHDNWMRLTDAAWVSALPARIWVDWASTVLRLALGMGYLWEAAWYETLARGILRGDLTSFDQTREQVPPVIQWKSTQVHMSVRDVASPTGWRVRRSVQVRSLLEQWIASHDAKESSFGDTVRRMGQDDVLTADLEEALGSRQRANDNMWEAVKYALKTRDTSGPYADHYGLLRSRGRYLWVEPGTEWTAVIASLCCDRPDSTTDLASVLRSLGQLGLHPELTDVVALLEDAGLARGSADADQGVVVQSAF